VSSSIGRVLVTGASGFIGAHAIPLLAAGNWEIHAVRRAAVGSSTTTGPHITWYACDLREPDDARALIERVRPTHILHLAWNAEHGTYWTAEDNQAWTQGTLVLARAFADRGGRRFVAAGTCAEYDWTSLSAPCVEDQTPCRPQTPYGRAKLEAATGIMSIARETGLSAAWGRLFFLYGSGENGRRLIPSVARALRNGERAQVTTGTQVRDFLHVSDAASAFVELLAHTVTGVVNVGSGVPVSVRAVVEILARAAGRPDAVDFGAVPMQPNEPPMVVADVQRLESIGWRRRIALEEGLAAIIEQT
jgi:nucleoside-diphosphate-sugar epimerase